MISYIEKFKEGLKVESIENGWLWADKYLYLPQKGNPMPGKYYSSNFPPMREIQEALSVDNPCQIVDVMKGVQISGTLQGIIAVLQRMHIAPQDIIAVFPTLELCSTFSKDKFTETVNATPCLQGKIRDSRERDSNNLILSKDFTGGSIKFVTANSSAALRMSSAGFIYLEEVDEYKSDVNGQGNAIELIWKRAVNYSKKKRYCVSSPTIKGASEIEEQFLNGTQENCYLPCPFCKHKQVLKWENIKWENEDPTTAKLQCSNIECKKLIDEKYKEWMLENYEWRAHAVPRDKKRRSFHISSLYSRLGWFSWADCVNQFLNIKGSLSLHKTFVNTVLGLPFEEDLETVSNLHGRKEKYNAKVPEGVLLLTCAVDVQASPGRLEVLVVGWGLGERCWTIEQQILKGSPADPLVWDQLDAILNSTYKHENGLDLRIVSTCIDTAGGFEKQAYAFCKGKFARRVFAIKGSSVRGKPLVSRPTKSNKGKVELHIIGTDTAKRTLFSRLKLEDTTAMGYIHFHEDLDEEFFLQLGAEKLVLIENKMGYKYYAYKKIRDRNEAIDLFVYNMAALELLRPNWVRIAESFTERVEENKQYKQSKESEEIKPKEPAKKELPPAKKPEAPKPEKTKKETTDDKRKEILNKIRPGRNTKSGIKNW